MIPPLLGVYLTKTGIPTGTDDAARVRVSPEKAVINPQDARARGSGRYHRAGGLSSLSSTRCQNCDVLISQFGLKPMMRARHRHRVGVVAETEPEIGVGTFGQTRSEVATNCLVPRHLRRRGGRSVCARSDNPADARPDHGSDEQGDGPASPPEAARLSDERLGIPCGHLTRPGPGAEQCHDTASIMAMTSAGW